jgi:hypothetical protein
MIADEKPGACACAARPTECEGVDDPCVCLGLDGTNGSGCTDFDDGHVEIGSYL